MLKELERDMDPEQSCLICIMVTKGVPDTVVVEIDVMDIELLRYKS